MLDQAESAGLRASACSWSGLSSPARMAEGSLHCGGWPRSGRCEVPYIPAGETHSQRLLLAHGACNTSPPIPVQQPRFARCPSPNVKVSWTGEPVHGDTAIRPGNTDPQARRSMDDLLCPAPLLGNAVWISTRTTSWRFHASWSIASTPAACRIVVVHMRPVMPLLTTS